MRSVSIAMALVLLGCSGKIDEGTDASSSDAGNDAPIAATGLAGTWVGYVESFKFGDGSDAVTMKLSDAGAGTVFFGNGAPLAPPTNPDIGYPPAGVDAREGFAFTNLQPVFAAPRLTFSVASNEVHKAWCELQTVIYPVYNGASDGGCGALLGYDCLPNASVSGGSTCSWSSCDHPTPTLIDCAKVTLCELGTGACACTQTSCSTKPQATGDVAFDVRLSGNKLDGSVTGLDSQLHNVHLTRQ